MQCCKFTQLICRRATTKQNTVCANMNRLSNNTTLTCIASHSPHPFWFKCSKKKRSHPRTAQLSKNFSKLPRAMPASSVVCPILAVLLTIGLQGCSLDTSVIAKKAAPTKKTAPVPQGQAGSMCDNAGDPNKRVWFACTGAKFDEASGEERAMGVDVASEMKCTEEVSFECLCCIDFTKPLPFTRVSVISLKAAQIAKGQPGAMVDDEDGADAKDRVLICTHEKAVGRLVKSKGPVSLPTECIAREFSSAELYGTEVDSKTKQSLLPGQVIFDERIQFLIRQGIPASGIPKCNEAMDGTCPTGTPKAGQEPNSAGDRMLKVLLCCICWKSPEFTWRIVLQLLRFIADY